ncbi:hypothetical protein BKA70DRAFT_1228135 [Coprinopsis sp. MPI-PUGE-AT-0042]|nr:hypothetical protein BKA70DRAFT_1228135 [Coprinopsis sp. MPI-PUGE-AT-0042]
MESQTPSTSNTTRATPTPHTSKRRPESPPGTKPRTRQHNPRTPKLARVKTAIDLARLPAGSPIPAFTKPKTSSTPLTTMDNDGSGMNQDTPSPSPTDSQLEDQRSQRGGTNERKFNLNVPPIPATADKTLVDQSPPSSPSPTPAPRALAIRPECTPSPTNGWPTIVWQPPVIDAMTQRHRENFAPNANELSVYLAVEGDTSTRGRQEEDYRHFCRKEAREHDIDDPTLVPVDLERLNKESEHHDLTMPWKGNPPRLLHLRDLTPFQYRSITSRRCWSKVGTPTIFVYQASMAGPSAQFEFVILLEGNEKVEASPSMESTFTEDARQFIRSNRTIGEMIKGGYERILDTRTTRLYTRQAAIEALLPTVYVRGCCPRGLRRTEWTLHMRCPTNSVKQQRKWLVALRNATIPTRSYDPFNPPTQGKDSHPRRASVLWNGMAAHDRTPTRRTIIPPVIVEDVEEDVEGTNPGAIGGAAAAEVDSLLNYPNEFGDGSGRTHQPTPHAYMTQHNEDGNRPYNGRGEPQGNQGLSASLDGQWDENPQSSGDEATNATHASSTDPGGIGSALGQGTPENTHWDVNTHPNPRCNDSMSDVDGDAIMEDETTEDGSQHGEDAHNPTTNSGPSEGVGKGPKTGQKNSRAVIRFATLNMRGGGSPQSRNKWNHVNQLMRDGRIDVLALQETHITQHGKSANLRRVIPGKALLCSLQRKNGELIHILAIYAPSGNNKLNEEFWNRLQNTWKRNCNLPKIDVMLGDFNVCETMLDRIGSRADGEKAIEALEAFRDMHELRDGWQAFNELETDYTFTSGKRDSGTTRSRLDRIYMRSDLLKLTREWQIETTAIKTDHRMASAQLTPPLEPYVGPGRSSIPLFIIEDENLAKKINELGKSLEKDMRAQTTRPGRETTNIQILWKKFKDIMNEASAAIKRKMRNVNKNIRIWEKRRRQALEKRGELLPDELTLQLNEIDEQIARLQEQKAARMRDQIAARHHLEGETNSKYDWNLNRAKKP